MKKLSLTLAVALLATAFTSVSYAIPINGRIDIGAYGSTVGIDFATDMVSFNGGIGGFNAQVTNSNGDYLAAGAFAGPISTKVNYSNFDYSPVGALPSGLLSGNQTVWQIGTLGASFRLETLTYLDEGATGNTLALTGLGTAFLTGYDPTPGLWSFSADRNQGQVQFSFSSTAQVPPPGQQVPDGGSAVLMLGAAISALGLIARFSRKS